MSATVRSMADADQLLADEVARYYADPLGFALFAWPWGEGQLEGHVGPNRFQERYLDRLGRLVAERRFDGVTPVAPILISTASGHGIGKSALVGMIVMWLMSTRPWCKGVVTANTAPQLRTKTWAEVSKWHRLCISGHWFELRTGLGNMTLAHRSYPDTWRCDGQTCREENSEAFAGLHAANSTPFYIFDEASAIPERIHEVSEGGLTDGEPMKLAFGNPTRSSGWFYNTHHLWRNRWVHEQIDSRKVEGTNKNLFDEWAEQYGEDSDFFRVRVRGEFPSQSSWQFIPTSTVEAAMARDIPPPEKWQPIIVGVDVARSGENATVFYTRQGRDGRSFDIVSMHERDLMVVADRLAEHIERFRPDAVFIDGGGVGGGLVDRMHQMNFAECHEVNFATSSGPSGRFLNKRAEMWSSMKDWLSTGVLPSHNEVLKSDLISPEYMYTRTKNQLQLEPKDMMEARGLASPDIADALALTFAHPVGPRGGTTISPRFPVPSRVQFDYDPLESP